MSDDLKAKAPVRAAMDLVVRFGATNSQLILPKLTVGRVCYDQSPNSDDVMVEFPLRDFKIRRWTRVMDLIVMVEAEKFPHPGPPA